MKPSHLPTTEFKPKVRIRLLYGDNHNTLANSVRLILREKFTRFSVGVDMLPRSENALKRVYAADFFRTYLAARSFSHDGQVAILPVTVEDLLRVPFSERILVPKAYVLALRSVPLGESSTHGFRQVKSISGYRRGILLSLDWMKNLKDEKDKKEFLTYLVVHQMGELLLPNKCTTDYCIRSHPLNIDSFFGYSQSSPLPNWFCYGCLENLKRI